MGAISLTNIEKIYQGNRAIDGVSLELAEGSFTTLLGPSGCGKSTTLRVIAGLITPDSGSVRFGGTDVTKVPVPKRNVGMVFQSLALFPHMSVCENIAYGLRMRGVDKATRQAKALDALKLVRLDNFADRYPHQMSGGQQQRVALARAIVFNPSVLLLDEPFAALDRKLREAMQQELHELTRRISITTVFVTHDQEEAMKLSDTVVVMNKGRVEQIGTPADIFDNPQTAFVADFMGVENIIPVELLTSDGHAAEVQFAGRRLTLGLPGPLRGDRYCVSLRPERISMSPEKAGAGAIDGVVETLLYHGSSSSYTISAGGQTLQVRELNPGVSSLPRFRVGDTVWLDWPDTATRLVQNAA